jgi:hypothetical protein
MVKEATCEEDDQAGWVVDGEGRHAGQQGELALLWQRDNLMTYYVKHAPKEQRLLREPPKDLLRIRNS